MRGAQWPRGGTTQDIRPESSQKTAGRAAGRAFCSRQGAKAPRRTPVGLAGQLPHGAMETAVVAVVVVLLVVTVVITCVLCCFSCDSRAPDPQGGPGRSFTVATFRQESSLFSGLGHHAQPVVGAQDLLTVIEA
ncbi:small regulatory polypeptide of amino acid response [Diceros bicornis minor]|uniref:small regulatory polypeptide of amino acid response n=1 Tax=Diceros bicornis minor TaxID=77932 RepID=UPI0026EC1107|nr:small regulatory polypeptide of amino acid response [Diceros bicornis minor]